HRNPRSHRRHPYACEVKFLRQMPSCVHRAAVAGNKAQQVNQARPGRLEKPAAYLTMPMVRGSQSVRSGIRVMAMSDAKRGMSQGKIAMVARSIDKLAT